MTLHAVLFLLVIAILMLVTVPALLEDAERQDTLYNLKFWAVVAAAIAVPWSIIYLI